MEMLKRRIREVGNVVAEGVLKLDAILNHQVEPELIMAIGREFAARYKESAPTKILTVESSGIPIAFATAYELGIPLIFARRKKTPTMDAAVYEERVPSFTKGIVTDIVISANYLQKGDRVVLIDDFIANGDAARGIIRIVERAEAEMIGVGIAVEKAFQPGGKSIREMGYRVDSLVRIVSLDNGRIVMD